MSNDNGNGPDTSAVDNLIDTAQANDVLEEPPMRAEAEDDRTGTYNETYLEDVRISHNTSDKFPFRLDLDLVVGPHAKRGTFKQRWMLTLPGDEPANFIDGPFREAARLLGWDIPSKK